MRKSRRNYYRLLHVQPEAPSEVIKAAYRALMQTMRMHPDLGGDHEHAAAINEAYAVLSDPAKRAAYDRTILPVIRRARSSTATIGGCSARWERDPSTCAQSRPQGAASKSACSFCTEPLPAAIHSDTRCRRCKSPLAPPPRMFLGRELGGRRTASRGVRNHPVDVQLAWRGKVCQALLRDISLTGMSFIAPVALKADQVVRVFDPDFEALVVVVQSRPDRSRYVIHAKLATLLTKRPVGVFVKTAA